MANVFEKLSAINVNDKVEKKNNLTYLSWAWAWAEALRHDPSANFHVHTFDVDGVSRPFMDVNGTAMVWVDVTMNGRRRTCWLPVMDHRNQPIPKPNAFQVNTALMRCLTKCLAMFGLGLYIYAGEDLPEGGAEVAQQAQETPKQEEGTAPPADPEIPAEGPLANLALFADGMMQYLEIAKDEKGLKSYWKANETQLGQLKANLPERYAQVRAEFTKRKEAFQKGEQQ